MNLSYNKIDDPNILKTFKSPKKLREVCFEGNFFLYKQDFDFYNYQDYLSPDTVIVKREKIDVKLIKKQLQKSIEKMFSQKSEKIRKNNDPINNFFPENVKSNKNGFSIDLSKFRLEKEENFSCNFEPANRKLNSSRNSGGNSVFNVEKQNSARNGNDFTVSRERSKTNHECSLFSTPILEEIQEETERERKIESIQKSKKIIGDAVYQVFLK